jgi:hypothetical protein
MISQVDNPTADLMGQAAGSTGAVGMAACPSHPSSLYWGGGQEMAGEPRPCLKNKPKQTKKGRKERKRGKKEDKVKCSGMESTCDLTLCKHFRGKVRWCKCTKHREEATLGSWEEGRELQDSLLSLAFPRIWSHHNQHCLQAN